MALLYFTVLFRDTQSLGPWPARVLRASPRRLSRYEGWFVIPFVTVYFLVCRAAEKARRRALVFGAIASLARSIGSAHNWWIYSNPLEFYNGPYSAKGHLSPRARATHAAATPAIRIGPKPGCSFATAVRLCAGWGAVIVGIARTDGRDLEAYVLAGAAGCDSRRRFTSGACTRASTPIFVPKLWFRAATTTRVTRSPRCRCSRSRVGRSAARDRTRCASVAGRRNRAAAVTPWLIHPQPDDWICWKESQVNSMAAAPGRQSAARLLAAEYQSRHRNRTPASAMTDAESSARPESRCAKPCTMANEPAWMAATARPDLFLHEEWALATSGDPVATAIQRATFKNGPRYHRYKPSR